MIETFIYRRIHHLPDLSWLRLAAIATIALSACLLAQIVLSYAKETAAVVCLCIGIFTLLGIQDFVFVPFMFNVLALFCSLLAYFVWSSRVWSWVRLPLALVLLEAAFFMYPSTPLLFLVPTVLALIFQRNWEASRKIWLKDLFFWGLAAGLYYLTVRVFFYHSLNMSGYEIAFTQQRVCQNIISFIFQGAPQVFNLWNIYASAHFGVCVIVLLVIIIAIDFLVTREMGWGRLGALISLFVVFNMVWFLFEGYMPRQFIGAQSLAVVLVYWCGEWLLRRWKTPQIASVIWPAVLMSLGLVSAFMTLLYNCLNYNAEIMFIRQRLAQQMTASTQEIHLVRLQGHRGYNGLPTIYDNLNGTSLAEAKTSDLIRAAVEDISCPLKRVIVTVSSYGEPYHRDKNTIVIDMNDLGSHSNWKKYVRINFDIVPNVYAASQAPVILFNDVDYLDHGIDFANQGLFDQALVCYRKALEVNPYSFLAYYNRARVYFELGNYSLAVADYRKAIESNPNFSFAYCNLGVVYSKLGYFGMALDALNQAIWLNSGSAYAYLNRGIVYRQLNNYSLGMADLNKALELSPNLAEAYYNRSLFYVLQGNYVQAIRDLDKAIQINKNFLEAYSERDRIRKLQGR